MAKLSKHFHFLQADSSRRGAEDIQWNEPNERANYSFFSLDDMFIRPWKCVCLARLSQSTLARMQHWQDSACERVCVFACFQVILYLYNSFSITADDEWVTIVPTTNTSWNLIWGNDGCQQLNVQYISAELKRRDTSSLSLSVSLPSSLPSGSGLLSVRVSPCVSVRGFWPTWHLPDLENRKSAASWLSPLNLTPNPFLLSASLVVPGALDLLTTIDRTSNYSRTVEGVRSKSEGGL